MANNSYRRPQQRSSQPAHRHARSKVDQRFPARQVRSPSEPSQPFPRRGPLRCKLPPFPAPPLPPANYRLPGRHRPCLSSALFPSGHRQRRLGGFPNSATDLEPVRKPAGPCSGGRGFYIPRRASSGYSALSTATTSFGASKSSGMPHRPSCLNRRPSAGDAVTTANGIATR